MCCVCLCDSSESLDVSRDSVGGTLSTDINFMPATKCRLYLKVFSCIYYITINVASGYARQHVLRQSPSLELRRVVAGRAFGVKILTLTLVCVAAAGQLVVIQ